MIAHVCFSKGQVSRDCILGKVKISKGIDRSVLHGFFGNEKDNSDLSNQ